VARHFAGGQWSWRAGGLMIQFVPFAAGQTQDLRLEETAEERDQSLHGDDDENWSRVRILAETVEDHELLDPTIAAERLLYRLFHEENVTAAEATSVSARCRCSRERIDVLLRSFGADELRDMREADGRIAVTCEFCSTRYSFSDEDLR
jgi:molecular chaperone Hsp33